MHPHTVVQLFFDFGSESHDTIVMHGPLTIFIVPPEVEVVASSSRVILGGSTTLTCNVTRTNPEVADIQWRNENTGERILETSDILLLDLSVVTDFGTYSCTVTNSAGEVGTGNLTITQGCKFIISNLVHYVPDIIIVKVEKIFVYSILLINSALQFHHWLHSFSIFLGIQSLLALPLN